ncbi:MAG: hypothetical protein BGO67_09965 [Alphaproteobacteria bacterium 41-28]|nr:MAG: hypothetical protein BGO67_09965 [Alphaproteobacteria bacterium 41-28]
MKKYFLFLIICLVPTSLFGKSITNQELLSTCKDKSTESQNFCYGFIISAANAAQFYRNIVDVEHEFIKICFPANISNKEIVDIFIAWAEKNLSVLESPAFIGVSTSFSKKYSCSTEKEEKDQKEDKRESQLENTKDSL